MAFIILNNEIIVSLRFDFIPLRLNDCTVKENLNRNKKKINNNINKRNKSFLVQQFKQRYMRRFSKICFIHFHLNH